MLSGFIIIEPVLYRTLHLAYARNWHWPSALTAGILLAAVPLTASILVLERLLRHPSPAEALPLAMLYCYVLAVTVLVDGVPILVELYRHALLTTPAPVMPNSGRDRYRAGDTYSQYTGARAARHPPVEPAAGA